MDCNENFELKLRSHSLIQKTVFVYFSPNDLEFFNKWRSGWLNCSSFGTSLLMYYTDPRKERSFYSVFGASRPKNAEVLLSVEDIADCEIC